MAPPPFASPHAPVTAGSPSSSADRRMTNLAESIERGRLKGANHENRNEGSKRKGAPRARHPPPPRSTAPPSPAHPPACSRPSARGRRRARPRSGPGIRSAPLEMREDPPDHLRPGAEPPAGRPAPPPPRPRPGLPPPPQDPERRHAVPPRVGAVAAVRDQFHLRPLGVVAQPRLGHRSAGAVARHPQHALALPDPRPP